uniref:sensor histidine kinase n=1 Tax=Acetatifactor sp. TaxID=1872090 RepID=UPI004055A1F5
MIFSLAGYFIAVFVNHMFSIPLSLLGISVTEISTQHPVIFLITVTAVTAFLLLLIKKHFLRPKLKYLLECPKKLQYFFLIQLLVCVVLFTVNFVYGEAVGYPAEVLSLNGLIITIFTLFTMVLFYCLYLLLQENYELKLHQKEQEMLRDYTERVESFYEEFRVFRHDYKNILSTLSYYIEESNVAELQTYFQEKILPTGESLSSDKFALSKLHLIQVPAVKSLLYTKLLSALNKEIALTLEIAAPLTEVCMDELDLSRILGILIDNSIEAALLTQEKLLTIAIVITEDAVLFSFVNSCPSLDVPVSTLSEQGYTTKEAHDGLGLYTVQNIVDSLEHVTFTMQYDGQFRQVLEISKP